MSFSKYNSGNGYSEMKLNDLVKQIEEELVPNIIESFETIILHLRSAHSVEPKEQEVTYILGHVEKLFGEFKTHCEKEAAHVFPAKHFLYTDDHHHETSFANVLDDCQREHIHFRNEQLNIQKLSESFHYEVNASPSHKLAYAQLGVLEQDLQRLFFIEEQYLFPKLRKSIRVKN